MLFKSATSFIRQIPRQRLKSRSILDRRESGEVTGAAYLTNLLPGMDT